MPSTMPSTTPSTMPSTIPSTIALHYDFFNGLRHALNLLVRSCTN
jgi:hypothetical protein